MEFKSLKSGWYYRDYWLFYPISPDHVNKKIEEGFLVYYKLYDDKPNLVRLNSINEPVQLINKEYEKDTEVYRDILRGLTRRFVGGI